MTGRQDLVFLDVSESLCSRGVPAPLGAVSVQVPMVVSPRSTPGRPSRRSHTEEVDMAKPIRAVALVAVGALGLAACASGSSSSSAGGGGGGGKTLIISTDLPLQGANKDASDSTNQAIELYLKSINNKVGDYTIQLQKYDDSTAAAAKWDQAQCQ